jgi:FlaG/FlaF family flagellin (archaellin)
MVAVVVILAATASVFIFDTGGSLNEPAPNIADTTGEFVPGSAPDQQLVRITHRGGDNVAVEEIEIIVRASGPGVDTDARLVDLPAEGQFMTDNINGNVDLIDSRTSTANIIEEDSSNTWTASTTIQFRISITTADFEEPPSYDDADRLEVITVHTPSNAIISEHTFTP